MKKNLTFAEAFFNKVNNVLTKPDITVNKLIKLYNEYENPKVKQYILAVIRETDNINDEVKNKFLNYLKLLE
jgi:hypothetical protein